MWRLNRGLIKAPSMQGQTPFTAGGSLLGASPSLAFLCQKGCAVILFIPLNIELLYDDVNSSVIFLIETLGYWRCCRLFFSSVLFCRSRGR